MKEESKMKKYNFLKMFIFIVIASISIIGIASATQATSIYPHGWLSSSNNNLPIEGVTPIFQVYTTATCSGSPIYNTSGVTTDNKGYWYLPSSAPTIQLDYNTLYYYCLYDGTTLLNGPRGFRAGQGQIDENDVYFTDLLIHNDLNVSGDISGFGDINISGIYYGDASGLNNTVHSIFGRTGTVVAQSNDYTWNQINKTVSSISDITTRNINLLSDVNTVGVANSNILQYNSTSGNWEAEILSSSSSYWNRTGTTLEPKTAGDNVLITGTHLDIQGSGAGYLLINDTDEDWWIKLNGMEEPFLDTGQGSFAFKVNGGGAFTLWNESGETSPPPFLPYSSASAR